MKKETRHYPGRHCASTALCNLANYHGIRWSEPTCFGLGAGLGFSFINIPGSSPGSFIHVRSSGLEEHFFRHIKNSVACRQYTDPAEGERDLCSLLDRGLPALALTDIYYLPYFNTGTHFPGHAVTVWGYNREDKLYYVSDTEREEILEVPFENMREARFCKDVYLSLKGDLYCPDRLSMPPDMPGVIRKALVTNSRNMMTSGNSFQGLDALAKWGEAIADWQELPDWQWCSRFCYQVIEKRGTGGGGFRLMYAEFLREWAPHLPQISSSGLYDRMDEVAAAWTDLAFSLKEASEREDPDFREASARICRVYELESSYHRKVLELFNRVDRR